MGTTTTNYSLNKPTVGGDDDAWGGLINTSMDTIDTQMKANADAAATAQTAADASVQDSDIGVTVQAYDADTAKTNVAQTYTAKPTFGAGVDVTGAVTAARIDISNIVPQVRLFETDSADLNTKIKVNAGNLDIDTINDADSSSKVRFRLDNTEGDISFYNSAGTAARFFWDASAENLSIGTAHNNGLKIGLAPTSSQSNGITYTMSSPYTFTDIHGSGLSGGWAGGIRFFTSYNSAATERARIDSSGNMGLGVVPENSSGTWRNFEIGGANIASRHANANDAMFGTGYVFKTSNAEHYKNTEAVSRVFFNNDTISFQQAPSGTADTAISWTTAMTIDNSGSVDLGAFSFTGATGGHRFYAGGEAYSSVSTTGNGDNVRFYNPNGLVGTIQTSGSSTSYNTSSDYRLKTNVTPMTGATATLKQLKPCNFDWIADGSNVNGFIAHELQAVVPEAATGTKDAMRDEEYEVSAATGDVFTPAIEEVTEERQVTETVEAGSYVNLAGETIVETTEKGVFTEITETVVQRQDIDGVSTEVEVQVTKQVPTMETVITTAAVAEVIHSSSVAQPDTLLEGQQWRETTAQVMGTRSVPDMQGIDQAKLVPVLTAALQEAIARIEALENA